ncbi:STAS domain-containing protein [Streptomyces collinus]|uniref:STAS domain-containing protein n=1 Tax=Streptomyces collinus TaxID=42684 RepID=UPI0033272D8C
MDSSEINVLLAADLDAAATDGGRLRLAAVQPPVMHTLDIVGLPHIIPCYSSVDREESPVSTGCKPVCTQHNLLSVTAPERPSHEWPVTVRR